MHKQIRPSFCGLHLWVWWTLNLIIYNMWKKGMAKHSVCWLRCPPRALSIFPHVVHPSRQAVESDSLPLEWQMALWLALTKKMGGSDFSGTNNESRPWKDWQLLFSSFWYLDVTKRSLGKTTESWRPLSWTRCLRGCSAEDQMSGEAIRQLLLFRSFIQWNDRLWPLAQSFFHSA